MKGAEERDYLFGKLFALFCILQSNQMNSYIQSNPKEIIIIFNQLSDLYYKKTWLREVTTEAILLLLDLICKTIKKKDITFNEIFDKVKTFLPKSLEDTLENKELQLSHLHWVLGLQALNSNKHIQIKNLLNEMNLIFTLNSFQFHSILLLNSSNGFPKIHRIWEYILGLIFSLSSDRYLTHQRYVNLVISLVFIPTV